MTALAEAIVSQGDVVERALGLDLEPAIDRLRGAQRIWLVGTGTSQHAAELGAWMLTPAHAATQWRSAATFARFGPRLDEDDAVVIISHTAETAFARLARARSLTAGARVISITGEGSGWPEAVEAIPRERSETYTASYMAALVVLARFAQGLGAEEIRDADLAALPARLRAAALAPTPDVEAPDRLLVIAGAGPAAITAREGAVKLREAARVTGEGFEAEYLLHGSAVPLDARDTLLLLQPKGDPDGLLGAIGAAAAASSVRVATVEEPESLPPALTQIPLTVRLQTLACRLADECGHDPDAVITGAWAANALWLLGAPN